MGGRFVESVKNAQWSMSSQEARDGLEIIVEFQILMNLNFIDPPTRVLNYF